MTQLDIVADVWEAVKHNVNASDISEAADSLVNVLVDAHGIDPQEVYDQFSEHPAIRKAVKAYMTQDTADDYERDYDDLYDDEDED